MTNPFSVPVEDLDAVHVPGEELVVELATPLRWAAGGAGLPFGDGGGSDVDGDGD